jgi:hypothetical protein
VFAVCLMRLIVAMVSAFCSLWLLLYGNYCSNKIPGPFSRFIYVFDQCCQKLEAIFLQQFQYILRYIIISCSPLIVSSPWYLFPFHCVRCKGLSRLHLLTLHVQLLGFPVK